MISSKRYNLNAGPFSLCSGTRDENSKSYKRATVTEIGECCLQTCVPTIKECHELCKDSNNPEACHQTCNDIKESCEYNCMLSNAD